MRKMLLSFRADVYERILSGEKIYEHRNVFPNEEIEAYLYVSKPMQCITGKMILGSKIDMNEWILEYSYDDDVQRISQYIKKQKYAMEIREFRETNEIKLGKLREELSRFIVPQMYYYLDNTELLEYLEKNIKETGVVVKHNFDNIDSTEICKW